MCKFYFDYGFLNAHYRFYISKVSLAFCRIRTLLGMEIRETSKRSNVSLVRRD
nr:MAG TPA: hypothetical protein [Caudoviricetes sp.]